MNIQTLPPPDGNATLCPLDHLGLLAFDGEDAQAFLQGQLTNDIKRISEQRAQIAGYCTAKGRLLATMLLWKTADGYCGQLHGDISATVQKRLSMYVLRSRVKVTDAAGKFARLGIAGRQAEAVLGNLSGVLPQQAMETVQAGGITILRLHGPLPRFEIIATPENMAVVRAKLESACDQADAPVWDWLDIQAGVPQIGPGTQEQFVPQMVNLDLLDGISFKKGCYTGQEIVARTHYLGKVKRRTHLAHIESAPPPPPGTAIYGADSTEPVGMVVNAAPAPGGGCDLLAEVRLESVDAGTLSLVAPGGPALALLPLPYALS